MDGPPFQVPEYELRENRAESTLYSPKNLIKLQIPSYNLQIKPPYNMNTDLFKQYQRALNVQRVNELNSIPKLTPKPLVFDETFDVSINDIPIEIKVPKPPQVMTKDQIRITNKPTSKSLF